MKIEHAQDQKKPRTAYLADLEVGTPFRFGDSNRPLIVAGGGGSDARLGAKIDAGGFFQSPVIGRYRLVFDPATGRLNDGQVDQFVIVLDAAVVVRGDL